MALSVYLYSSPTEFMDKKLQAIANITKEIIRNGMFTLFIFSFLQMYINNKTVRISPDSFIIYAVADYLLFSSPSIWNTADSPNF